MTIKKCKYCKTDFETKEQGRQFCSSSCSAKYNNNQRIFNPKEDKRTKKSTCVKCGEEIEVNIRADLNKCKCNVCKLSGKKDSSKAVKKQSKEINTKRVYKNKPCSVCGSKSTKECKIKIICRKRQVFPALVKYFGFDKSKIGTGQVYEEFNRVKNLLIEEYWNKQLSLPDISIKYNHSNVGNLSKILKSLDIDFRNFSEATHLTIINGKWHPKTSAVYKHGYHTTWNNKQVFYRSSYELDYCKELDEKKIDYEVEKLRILYWDSQLLRQRVAIPGFYLPETNEIVEIKGEHTYNEQNMKDKFKVYREHGYKVKLILEHEEKITGR
jgi:hypothetical protein